MPTIDFYVLRKQEIQNYIRRIPSGTLTSAACRGCDPNAYHPEVGRPSEDDLARCDSCVVATACIAVALRAEDPELRVGWYGGLGPADRAALAHSIAVEVPDVGEGSDRISRARELWDSGWKIDEIAAELGCSRRTIQRYLKQVA
jgi:hypothetical protein